MNSEARTAAARLSGEPPFRPLRLLLVNWRDPRNPAAGGAEVHLHEVARRLAAEGFACFQVSHAFAGAPAEEVIDGVRVLRRGNGLLFNFTVWFGLRRWCRDLRIDAVLDDSNKIAFFAPWCCNRPVVLQLHHLFGRTLFRETAWPAALYVLTCEALMPRAYRGVRVLTGSESSRRELAAKGFHPVSIAAEGVDPERYRLAAPPAREPNLVLYVGRVKRYKGLDVLLRALRALREKRPATRLAIAGTGDDTPRLRKLARDLGQEAAVDFLGFVSEARKIELYHRAAVVVNSSLKEGWGLTSIEANACGAPVVATDVPGLCDSVRHGETGFLVPFGDAAAFAQRLEQVLGDPGVWQRLSDHGRTWAAAHTWEPAYRETRAALLAAYGEWNARRA